MDHSTVPVIDRNDKVVPIGEESREFDNIGCIFHGNMIQLNYHMICYLVCLFYVYFYFMWLKENFCPFCVHCCCVTFIAVVCMFVLFFFRKKVKINTDQWFVLGTDRLIIILLFFNNMKSQVQFKFIVFAFNFSGFSLIFLVNFESQLWFHC